MTVPPRGARLRTMLICKIFPANEICRLMGDLMEIVPGVYLVDGTKGGNVYLLADRKMALIDTGMHGNAPLILKFINDLGRDPKDLESIIATHGHLDHIGSVNKLQTLTGAKILAHRDEVVPSGARYEFSLRIDRKSVV